MSVISVAKRKVRFEFDLGDNDISYLKWVDKKHTKLAAASDEGALHLLSVSRTALGAFSISRTHNFAIDETLHASLTWRVLSVVYLPEVK